MRPDGKKRPTGRASAGEREDGARMKRPRRGRLLALLLTALLLTACGAGAGESTAPAATIAPATPAPEAEALTPETVAGTPEPVQPTEEPDWTGVYAGQLEQTYRFLALRMRGEAAAADMGVSPGCLPYIAAAETGGPDPLDALGYAFLRQPAGGRALAIGPTEGRTGELLALYLSRGGQILPWEPREADARIAPLEGGKLLCRGSDGVCGLYSWADGEPRLDQQICFAGEDCSLLRPGIAGQRAQRSLSRAEGERLIASLLARSAEPEPVAFRDYPEAERLEQAIAAALELKADTPGADGFLHVWALQAESDPPEDCLHQGVKLWICVNCDAERIERYEGEHVMSWRCDESFHHQVCQVCGEDTGLKAHDVVYANEGWAHRVYCVTCSYYFCHHSHVWTYSPYLHCIYCGARPRGG